MVVTARGAVLKAFNEPLSIETAEISAPGPGAMVVRVTHGGV
ncbi:MAG: zinc-dependent alcohol dehydrogenase, partial [Thermomicrobiales bacterium]|nr:zinc-dependent alcohol dehydrogenase [Thermomicrobiales bacterium]